MSTKNISFSQAFLFEMLILQFIFHFHFILQKRATD